MVLILLAKHERETKRHMGPLRPLFNNGAAEKLMKVRKNGHLKRKRSTSNGGFASSPIGVVLSEIKMYSTQGGGRGNTWRKEKNGAADC